MAVVLLMFSLFGCFGKKPATSIEGRLEELFPGRYRVELGNLKMLDVMAQFQGEKRAIVAEKQNGEIQFVLDWQKGRDGLGVDAAVVARAHSQAVADYQDGKSLAAALHQQGLLRFSVGMMGATAFILVFEEPTPALREQALARIRKARSASGNLAVEFMEPGAYQTEFQEIIPRGHWLTDRAWHEEHKTASLELEGRWTVNAASKRSAAYHAQAFARAQAWAGQNLPKAVRWTPDKYATEAQGMTIRYGFPFYTGTAEEPSGYVCVHYDVDKAASSQVRKQKEF